VVNKATRGHTLTNLAAKHTEKTEHLEQLKPALSKARGLYADEQRSKEGAATGPMFSCRSC
jgi:hypothetical protein